MRIDRWLQALSGCLFITGGLLVYPKHYTFTTPWIVAAFMLLTLITIFLAFSKHLKLRFLKKPKTTLDSGRSFKLLLAGCYCLAAFTAVFIVHDAITKTTLFPIGSP